MIFVEYSKKYGLNIQKWIKFGFILIAILNNKLILINNNKVDLKWI